MIDDQEVIAKLYDPQTGHFMGKYVISIRGILGSAQQETQESQCVHEQLSQTLSDLVKCLEQLK